MKDKKKAYELLNDYFYVFYETMSAPREICKFAFHPEEKQSDFCAKKCCFPKLDDFVKICKYFQIKNSDDSIWDLCIETQDEYIKGCNDKNDNNLNKRIQIKSILNIREKRKQIVKYFWLYTYIFLGPEKHNEFFNLLNKKDFNPNDNKFNNLISEFKKKSNLSDNFEINTIYTCIQKYSESKKVYFRKN